MQKRIPLLALAAAGLALFGATLMPGAADAGKRPGGQAGVLKAAVQYIGLTRAEFAANVKAGQSLAQMATAKGKTVEGLKQAISSAVKAKLDAAVAAGRLSAARAQQLLSGLQAHLDRLVNRVPKLGMRAKRGPRGGLLKTAIEYIGLNPAELKANLAAGQSLAQMATAKGKSVEGLKQAISNAVKAKLDAGVAAGRLSAERAQQMLSRLQSHLDRLVNRAPRQK